MGASMESGSVIVINTSLHKGGVRVSTIRATKAAFQNNRLRDRRRGIKFKDYAFSVGASVSGGAVILFIASLHKGGERVGTVRAIKASFNRDRDRVCPRGIKLKDCSFAMGATISGGSV